MLEVLAEIASEVSDAAQEQNSVDNPETSDYDRFDDNGHEYRDESGGHIPNNTYEIDGRVYETDDLGNIYCVDGKYFPDDVFVLDDVVFETDENGEIITRDGSEASPETKQDQGEVLETLEQEESEWELEMPDPRKTVDTPQDGTDTADSGSKADESNDAEDGQSAAGDVADEDDAPKTRELTNEEREELKEKLGWTDKQLDKCTIDEDGVIHYKTDREDMEGKTGENGVRYERKTVDINGVKVEGVFPVFDSAFDAQLPKELEKSSNAKQFKECNEQLKEAIENDPDLKAQFTEEQLQDIEEGRTPEGYVWHHNEETGKMQLVKAEDHDRTQGGAAHTGGKALWGGSYGGNELTSAETNSQGQLNDGQEV